MFAIIELRCGKGKERAVDRIIFHIDANSAYLSWTAAHLLERGFETDLRTVPAVIAGDPENRHGIILAKSIPAKKRGIGTAMSLGEARGICPELIVVRPDYDLYLACSDALYGVLCRYSSLVERYSIDECFLDFTASQRVFGPPEPIADRIRKDVERELGFTVNVGVSVNKILAKMASEMEKPDRTHTLYPEEIPEKLWPQDVSELFMVGRATTRKLRGINVTTIGAQANTDRQVLKALLKSHGDLVWRYANGIDDSPVLPGDRLAQKSVGNGITMPYDVIDCREADEVMLALCERVGGRLRRLGVKAGLVTVGLRSGDLSGWYSHQGPLDTYRDSTTAIYRKARQLFRECWRGEPLRQIGVSVSDFMDARWHQVSLWDLKDLVGEERLSRAVDDIRRKYGERSLIRGTFANSPVRPVQGGVHDGDYLMMGGYRNENLG